MAARTMTHHGYGARFTPEAVTVAGLPAVGCPLAVAVCCFRHEPHPLVELVGGITVGAGGLPTPPVVVAGGGTVGTDIAGQQSGRALHNMRPQKSCAEPQSPIEIGAAPAMHAPYFRRIRTPMTPATNHPHHGTMFRSNPATVGSFGVGTSSTPAGTAGLLSGAEM